MAWLPEQTLADFATVARLAGVSLAADDIRIEALPAPHAPPLARRALASGWGMGRPGRTPAGSSHPHDPHRMRSPDA